MSVTFKSLNFVLAFLSIVAVSEGLPIAKLFGTPPVIAQTVDGRKAEADRLLNQGIQLYENDQLNAAIPPLQQALALYRQIKDRNGERRSLGNLGFIYTKLGQYAQALDFENQSLAIAIEIKHRLGEGQALGGLSDIYRLQGNFDQAIEYSNKSLAIMRELKNRKEEAYALSGLGIIYHNLKDYKKSIEFHQQSLTIYTELRNQSDVINTLINIGIAYRAQNQNNQALEYYQRGLKVAREANDKVNEAKVLRRLGTFYQSSDFSKAYTAFQGSLKLWRELKNRQQEANTLLQMGDFYALWNGNCSRAIEEAYTPSLPLFRELRDRGSEARALAGMGQCYADEHAGNEKAFEVLNQGLTLAREVNDRWTEGRILTSLGKSYQSLDERKNNRWKSGILSTDFSQSPASIEQATKALRYSQQGLKLAQEAKNRWGEARALANLGRTYGVLGEHQKAIDSQKQRLIITREYQDTTAEAETLNLLGRLYAARGEFSMAIAHHQAALDLYQAPSGRKPNWLLMYLGDTYQQSGNYTKAIEVYEAALDPRKKNDPIYSSIETAIRRKMGYAFLRSNQLPQAASIFRAILSSDEEFRVSIGYGSSSKPEDDIRRVNMAELQASDYRELQKILVLQNRIEDALEVAEEARAKTLVELLFARMKGRQIPDFKTLPKPLKLAEIRQIAKTQNSTLVQYSLIDTEQLYIWVIKPSGEIKFQISKLAKMAPIEQMVAESRGSIAVISTAPTTTRSTTQPETDLQRLYQALVAPIVADLPTDPNQRVTFLPQGELFFVPFPALKDEQGQYLIEKHMISTAPSIQTLQLTREQAKKVQVNGNPLVVGDPKMPFFEGAPLTNLPGARQEAIAIAKLLNTQPLIGEQATKSTVLNQMKSASMIHLATHGLLNQNKDKVPGAIALAPSGSDDGFLTSSEIFDLKLNAHLAVLSACDTGRGDIKGDGVIGLSRSLIAAGVPSVVVSLWAVNDQSTSVFMSHFYRNLTINPNKAQALRQAMLDTMKQYPKPRDWAAFTLIGESDRQQTAVGIVNGG
ncbi:CHAT domain-containing protein [Alkalinema sp. FACHB-956]|uniref:CHAT domain-containing tetratricopeptide repeat protein n=1 Tax=Alkalinema sp. FACHB-956 TaxID=2692768 RepID=UPI0016896618|nr:CHAT domain-containing protein [Alkalinema sp. FACHB-956]MBD2327351.1 CHAT domain-containing protein [Alkalinema sp. FACHB-956]